MRRRDKAGGKAVKTQRRKTLKRRNAPKTARRSSSLAASKETNVARLARERDEALEQLAATSEMLQVISRSPGELEPVFEAMLANAARICEARFAILYLHDGNAFRAVAATHDAPPAYVESRKRDPAIRPAPDAPLGRVASTKQIVHIADLSKLQSYIEHHPFVVAAVELGGFRTALGVPLLKDNQLVGSMNIFRQEVRPFTDKQIELVKNFAAQAVIAIENTRLLNELRESLQQQTATADVLKVISSSPGELEPVFNAMLENATRICDAEFGTLYLREADAFRAVAIHNAPPAYVQARKRALVRPPPDSALGQVVTTHQVAQIDDITKTKSYIERDPYIISAVELGGYRTIAAVPMLKDDELVGAILIYRQEVRSFSEKQIALLRNFADQAVIAIENTRLLSELRQRTGALSELLDRQTAMSEVLGVISSSPTDLTPVFDTILANATRLCEGNLAALWRYDGECLVGAAQYNASAAFVEHYMGTKLEPGRSGPARLAALECRTVHVADITAEPGFSPMVLQYERARTVLAVPLLREKNLVGVIAIWRREVRPFTEQQIALVRTFADQAVIAIENARLLNELRESLQQQTATADVLKVISSSPGELEPVFQAILENATHICGAKFGVLWLSKDGGFLVAATHSIPAAYREQLQAGVVFHPGPSLPIARAASTRQAVHIADLRTDPGYLDGEPVAKGGVELGQVRTLLAMPMLKDREVVGAFAIYRQEVQPFTDKQIELVKNFAAQAVIAIENTRLLSELRNRTDDLTESLEQQTATSEVLQVISCSPGQLEPVFDTMLANATRICEAKIGVLYLDDGDGLRAVAATHDAPPAYVEARKQRWGWGKNLPLDGPVRRAATTKQVAHITDIRELQSYLDGHPIVVAAVELGKFRTAIGVPMLKDDELVGVITINRQEVRPFTDKQIELVKNFAAQAVIAIENTRLLSELRESLQQQTATADVLKVISSTPGHLQPVFDTMLAKATDLCQASYGTMWVSQGDGFRTVAMYGGLPPAWVEQWRSGTPYRPLPNRPLARVAESRQPIQITDLRDDQSYLEGDPLPVAAVEIAGIRTLLVVPMFKESELVGAIAIYRKEVRPFTDKQIALVTNFAAQAVIAIENTRLLSELRESLQQQTATADVLKVISRSTFDLQVVLDTLVESAATLCEADSAAIHRPIGGSYPYVASHGLTPEYNEYMRKRPLVPGRGTVLGRAITELKPVQVNDVAADPEYTMTEARKIGGFRTVLGVPLLREGAPIGIIMLTRNMVRPFTDKQIELVSTFADQAAIAIENVRLFESVEARTRELAFSLEDLRTTQDRLVQTQKLASLGQLTAGIAHEIKNPLNFVNNFSGLSAELIGELQEALADVNLNEKRRNEITELMDTLRGNLDKVVQHGKRADAIVKNMLLHSREGSGEHRPVDINTLVDEGLNLAYHGARAEKQGFTITLQRSFDPGAGEIDVFPQDITRALLNLISNGFYAATQRKVEVNGGNYEPILTAATKNLGDRVEITIRDNGTGIPLDVKEKMFNPFFTTKPAGEGTGLGLSISHDIIVKQHGGSIEVDTQPGEFTEIRVVLPRVAALLPERS